MPSKSRRNRRPLPQNKATVASPVAAGSQASTGVVAPAPKSPPYSGSSRAAAVDLSYPYIGNEIKWIAIVTVVVAVVLVVAYMIFR